MKKNFTSISIVLDRSGSMQSTLEPTIEGFNTFIEQQKNDAAGNCIVSLHQFDNRYQTDYMATSINDVPELDTSNFKPRGTTALLDAIGRTIKELGDSLSAIDETERPDTVIVAILTDGYENSSSEYDLQKINEMITHQTEKYNWEFMFLGAGQDAIATASQFGISEQNSMTYSANSKGTIAAFHSMSKGLSRKLHSKRRVYKSGGTIMDAVKMSKSVETFTEDDREEQREAGAKH